MTFYERIYMDSEQLVKVKNKVTWMLDWDYSKLAIMTPERRQ